MSEEFGKGKDFGHDPVFEVDGAWYFWDETWADKLGPFASEAEARTELRAYCATLELGHEEPG